MCVSMGYVLYRSLTSNQHAYICTISKTVADKGLEGSFGYLWDGRG